MSNYAKKTLDWARETSMENSGFLTMQKQYNGDADESGIKREGKMSLGLDNKSSAMP